MRTVTHRFHCIPARSVVATSLLALVLLAGCGSSDESKSSLYQSGDLIPSGERIDLRAKDYFRSKAGDRWTYAVDPASATTLGPFQTRTVIRADDQRFTVRTDELGYSGTEEFRRDEEGIVLVNPFGSDAPQARQDALAELLAYPEPFFSQNPRTAIREGDWGEDIDDDGKTEQFELILKQDVYFDKRYDLPHERIDDAIEVRTRLELSVWPSGDPSIRFRSIQTTTEIFAPHVGLVRSSRLPGIDGAPNQPVVLTLTEALLDGKPLQPRPVDLELVTIELIHNGLVYDPVRNVYLATVPATEDDPNNRIVTIDGLTGRIVGDYPLGEEEPSTLALSEDSSSLFIGFRSDGTVAKLRTSDFAEQYRFQLPLDLEGMQSLPDRIAISPLSNDIVAVSFRSAQAGVKSGGVLVAIEGAVQPRQLPIGYHARLLSFSPDGAELYTYSNGDYPSVLRKLSVWPDGVVETLVAGFQWLYAESIQFVNGRLLMGLQFIDPDNLALTQTIEALRTIDLYTAAHCVSNASQSKLICETEGLVTLAQPGMRLKVIDAESADLLADPLYTRAHTRGEPVSMLRGPACSVALRTGNAERIAKNGQPDLRQADKILLLNGGELC